MKLTTEKRGEVLVFALRGKIMGGPESTQFHEQLKQAIARGERKVVLDLGGVEWMNSSGLGLLISGFTTMRNAGSEMKLARTTDKIQSLLVITKLNTIFECHDTVEGAVNSF
ncbi:MAG: STAS domain-containing protein [bacterium]